MTTNVILIAGKIASGKSTMAYELKDQLTANGKYTIIRGFAWGVKEVAMQGFGWDGIKDAKGRRLLQVVGTEAGREYNKDIWANKAYMDGVHNNSDQPDFLIMDDWRFPNELEVWKGKPEIGKIFTIRCYRDGEETSDHVSETSLPYCDDPYFYDYLFDNNVGMDELGFYVEQMLFDLEII